MTSKTTYEITDEQIAEIEALALKTHESTADLFAYGNAISPSKFLALISRLRAAERDAARYQFLRDSGKFSPSAFGDGWALNCGYTRAQPSLLDAAVDAAMSETKP